MLLWMLAAEPPVEHAGTRLLIKTRPILLSGASLVKLCGGGPSGHSWAVPWAHRTRQGLSAAFRLRLRN